MMTSTQRKSALMGVVISAGVGLFVISLAGLSSSLGDRTYPWLGLLAVTILIGLFPVRIPGTRSVISVTDAFVFTSVLFFGVFASTASTSVLKIVSAASSRV